MLPCLLHVGGVIIVLALLYWLVCEVIGSRVGMSGQVKQTIQFGGLLIVVVWVLICVLVLFKFIQYPFHGTLLVS